MPAANVVAGISSCDAVTVLTAASHAELVVHVHAYERGALDGSEEAEASRSTAHAGDALRGATKDAMGGGMGSRVMLKSAVASGTVFGRTARIE